MRVAVIGPTTLARVGAAAGIAPGGHWLAGLCPSSGVSEPAAAVAVRAHRDRCHEVVDDLSWYEQAGLGDWLGLPAAVTDAVTNAVTDAEPVS